MKPTFILPRSSFPSVLPPLPFGQALQIDLIAGAEKVSGTNGTVGIVTYEMAITCIARGVRGVFGEALA